jgi:peptidoglycan pentaglycine glycine transferase (the first glycine)
MTGTRAHEWDAEVRDRGGDFFQSFAWGEFQERLGKRVFRKSAGSMRAQFIEVPLPLNKSYLYVPMGPLGDGEKGEFLAMAAAVRARQTVFLECELIADMPSLRPLHPNPRLPRQVCIIDLRDLARAERNMHPALRYKIRLASRRGVTVEREESWERFGALYHETMRRKGLRGWFPAYLAAMKKTLVPRNMVEIWGAYHHGELVCANLYVLFGGRASYVLGASSYAHRGLMAPHLLHWRAMEQFSSRGFSEYDLGGIDARYGAGIARFKQGFGGENRVYPGTYRQVWRPVWYGGYRVARLWKHAAHSS